ncbi:PKS-NRPS hybrid synthetase [Tanacetum coccineum]|uniref:PKS-NRPS hybrid synthetase n=1 Tax=Tanacetum coccineum TaxID=301880 RepID=A0ABQ5J1R9_9ASTR
MNSIDLSSPMFQNEELYLSISMFESCDDLLKSVRAFYCAKGYGLSIRDSQKDKYVTLQCQRSGSYRDVRNIGDKRKRNTTSRLVECPFQSGGKKGSDGSWVFKVANLEHNHEPSTDMLGHPSFRRLEPDDVQSVKSMIVSGIPPRQMLTSLRQQTPNLPANSKTIYNLKAKIRRNELGDRSMVMALLDELEKGGFTYDDFKDSDGHITRLFIAHPLSIKLARLFPDVFVMDCTYKTNKYKMPLLDIIGVLCFNTSFYSGFAFLKNEDEDSNEWALNAFKKILGDSNQPSVIITDRELALLNGIKKVFPTTTSLLCIWHIKKNVFSNCKTYFEHAEDFDIFMSTWNVVAYSTTEALFNNNWADFELFYKGKKDAMEYIKKNWFPWKEKFVSAWTEKYLHFGNRASSRAESAHAKLKKYLQVSTGDFQQVKKKLCLEIEHEFNEIKEIHKQYVKAKDGKMNSCTGHFTATMGLACVHKIKHMKGNVLSLDLVHSHWRIDTISLIPEADSQDDDAKKFVTLLGELRSKYKVWPLHKKEFATSMITKLVNEQEILFDPVIQRPRGRPPKAKKKRGITSTTRDPMQNPSSSNHENNLINLNAYPDFLSTWYHGVGGV